MYYLKCELRGGAFSNEYAVGFRVGARKTQYWCFVSEENVKVTGEDTGLVKIIGLEKMKDKGFVIVELMDAGDHRISTYCVPQEEVVEV